MKQYMRKYSDLSLFDLGKMIYYKLKKRDSDRKYVYKCLLKWIEKEHLTHRFCEDNSDPTHTHPDTHTQTHTPL